MAKQLWWTLKLWSLCKMVVCGRKPFAYKRNSLNENEMERKVCRRLWELMTALIGVNSNWCFYAYMKVVVLVEVVPIKPISASVQCRNGKWTSSDNERVRGVPYFLYLSVTKYVVDNLSISRVVLVSTDWKKNRIIFWDCHIKFWKASALWIRWTTNFDWLSKGIGW